MGSKTKTFFIVLSFFLQSSLSTYVHAESTWVKAPAEDVLYSVTLPAKDRLTLVSFFPIFSEGKILGGLAAYDDVTTRRPADYLELINNAGALLVVGWFDSFGIERMAVDRALLENADELEGIFVLLLDGDSV